MFEKIKKMLTEKDEKKKSENLVAFLVILVITLIVVNKILSKDVSKEIEQNSVGVELVSGTQNQTTEVASTSEINLKDDLENILSKIIGVR